jgi:hypothetical protein
LGRFSALILEKGMIAKASSATIQIAKTIYSTLILDHSARFFLKSNNTTKKAIVDQNIEMVAVDKTLLLLDSEL